MRLRIARQIFFGLTALAFAGSCSHLPVEEGNFFVHRWNQGSTAEPRPMFSATANDSEARSFLNSGEIQGKRPLYAGCFLVVYKPEGRAPASRDSLLARGSHKVCME